MNIYTKIQQLEGTQFEAAHLKDKLQQGLLDELFEAIVLGLDWCEKMLKIFPDSSRIENLIEHLEQQKELIINTQIEHFQAGAFIGEEATLIDPSLIFIVSSEYEEELEVIAKHASGLAQKNPNAVVVACGGGFHANNTEAAAAKAILEDSGVSNTIICEEDSLDFVAMAVFSKLLLREASELPNSGNILICTTSHTSVRAKNIFEKVYGEGYNYVVSYPQSIVEEDELYDLTENELLSDSESSYDMFRIEDTLSNSAQELDIDLGDETSVFCQLMYLNELYKNRPDLIRKYKSLLNYQEDLL